jgi:hypothetical protein
MAGPGFLPDRDADLLSWANNANALIAPDPAAFGLSPAIAASFASALAANRAAMIGVEPGVRCQMNVSAKNAAKAALQANIRAWAKIVDGTAGITDAQRMQLGLNVRRAPSPIPAPSAAPIVNVQSMLGRTVRLRLRDGVRRGKPATARGAMVFSYSGDAPPPSSIGGWKFETLTARDVIDVVFPSDLPPGATVWLAALWIGSRLECGPACQPVSVTFGAAGVTMPMTLSA